MVAAATTNAAASTSVVAIFGAVVGAAAVLAAGFLNYLTQRWIQNQQRQTSDQQLKEQRELFERQLAEKRETSDSQLESARQQLELLREGQITERFMRAIDQLGSKSPQVRMGGVFALERIARESPLDRPHIVSTLTVLIRDRSPASAVVGESRYVDELMVRAPDAQAALTVLCRPPLSDDRLRSSGTGDLDLSRTDLRRARLEKNANLRGANLSHARLEGADLRWSDLRDSNFDKAHLGRYDPWSPSSQRGADLRYANLTGAQLQGAIDFSLALTEDTIGLATSTADRTS